MSTQPSPRRLGRSRGFDAGKRIKGRKRHIVADTLGLLVGDVLHPAGVQDRDGAPMALLSTRKSRPWLPTSSLTGATPGRSRAAR